MYDVVVKNFKFAISSPDEFLVDISGWQVNKTFKREIADVTQP